MNSQRKQFILSQSYHISQRVNFHDESFLAKLNETLTKPDLDHLQSLSSNPLKAHYFIDCLCSKNETAYFQLLSALRQSPDAKHLECAALLQNEESKIAISNLSKCEEEIIDHYPIDNQRKCLFIVNALQYDVTDLTHYFEEKGFEIKFGDLDATFPQSMETFFKEQPCCLFGLIVISERTKKKLAMKGGKMEEEKEKLVLRRKPDGDVAFLKDEITFRFRLKAYAGLPKFAMFVSRQCEYENKLKFTSGTNPDHSGETNSIEVDVMYEDKDEDGKAFLDTWMRILREEKNMDVERAVVKAEAELNARKSLHIVKVRHGGRRLIF